MPMYKGLEDSEGARDHSLTHPTLTLHLSYLGEKAKQILIQEKRIINANHQSDATDCQSAWVGLRVRSLRTNDSQGFLVHLLLKG